MASSKSLNEALQILKAVSGLKSDVGVLARELMPLLKRIPVEMTGEMLTRSTRRGTEKVAYLVETTQQGEVLSEERLSGRSKAFRCPMKVYEALARVLEATDTALGLDEIMTAMEKLIGDRPADHQVRVAMRLWMQVDPPLVNRNRARYRSSDARSFAVKATSLWDNLRSFPH